MLVFLLVGGNFLIEKLVILKIFLAEVVLDLPDKIGVGHCCNFFYYYNQINNNTALVNNKSLL